MKQEIALASGKRHAKMQVTSLPFSAVPGQSRLFLSYLNEPSSLSEFYPNLAMLGTDPRRYADRVLESFESDRAQLCDALSEINVSGGQAVFSNIERLRKSDTVAVVTGQQAGLFTGPLYTIYKAVTAVKLAAELTANGVTAVPVFWSATEDHDMDEVSTAHFVDREGHLFSTQYRPASYAAETPVGSAVLDGGIGEEVDDLFKSLPHTEFSQGAREIVDAVYSKGVGYGRAFAMMMSRLFTDYGLIVIDPMHAAAKRLASPAYVRAVERSDDLVSAIRGRTARLEAGGFHAQVLVDEDHFPLFWHDDAGRRSALRNVATGVYRAKHDRREFTREELVAIATSDPDRLSPNVMLRAVVQDYLLPTICYVGGAAEVAYFAQNSAAYETLGRPVTPIIHRQSFTIVEARQRRSLEKLGLSLVELFAGKDAVTRRIAENLHKKDLEHTFHSVSQIINEQLDGLHGALEENDPTLAANLDTRRRKINHHLDELERRSMLSVLQRDETTVRRLDALFTDLLPNGALQERTLNVLVYLNRFGPAFVDWIYEAADLDDRGHRIVEL